MSKATDEAGLKLFHRVSELERENAALKTDMEGLRVCAERMRDRELALEVEVERITKERDEAIAEFDKRSDMD